MSKTLGQIVHGELAALAAEDELKLELFYAKIMITIHLLIEIV